MNSLWVVERWLYDPQIGKPRWQLSKYGFNFSIFRTRKEAREVAKENNRLGVKSKVVAYTPRCHLFDCGERK